ncbi:MAG: biotin--[acetyl-CoA-carboxylase] ligase [Firmicutes bacterium]|nr:biotin--[acetyl-CoA-carboxylase] ligase [Dethiobacter sp.]MBS3897416.1 biotin--[acetyl-CoA-carboxylase] ligase [Dethiobacter sp.]MCL5992652.1 biotin--[acetyl-CoA-carboxylase] ligase [Bacillota bacterium]
MKETVLAGLKVHFGRYVSGGQLSNQLQVSRTAVWKHIGGLREDGYEIESSPRLGYRLVSVPDLLLPLEIRDGLRTKILGKQIHYRRTMDSTNRLARELAAAGAAEGTVILSEEQLAGRGRLGRSWVSPAGGIWLSLILRPQLAPHKAQLITLLAAVAAVEATQKTTGLVPGIKWPNDLLLGGRKLAGILTEVSAEMERVNYLVLGIGLNANLSAEHFQGELADSATSLLLELGQSVCRVRWVQNFLTLFEQAYLATEEQGFASVLACWRRYSVTLGQDVIVSLGSRSVHGTALDIDEQGALLVKTVSGLETFLSGEVSLKDSREG